MRLNTLWSGTFSSFGNNMNTKLSGEYGLGSDLNRYGCNKQVNNIFLMAANGYAGRLAETLNEIDAAWVKKRKKE